MVGAISIKRACAATDVAAVAALFRDYAASLDIDLDYQGFAEELAALPGQYAAPPGILLLARNGDGKALGCIACRPLGEAGTCEMKRLFVAPDGCGLGLGRMLVRQLLADAAMLGFTEMRLDTLASMKAAQALYSAEGFAPMPPYYDTPVPGTLFMRRPLA